MSNLSSAAIVWLRYRALYHSTPLADFREMQGVDCYVLARIYHSMLSDPDKPGVEEIKNQIESGELLVEALSACETLLNPEELAGLEPARQKDGKTEIGRPYDVYDFLTRFAMTGLPECLLYELPIFALERAIHAYFSTQEKIYTKSPDSVSYKKIDDPKEVMRILGGMA